MALPWPEPRSDGSVNRCYTGAFLSPLESLVPGPVFWSVVTPASARRSETIPFRRLTLIRVLGRRFVG